jgi:hypothetical protein
MEYVTYGKCHDNTICKDNGVLECLSYATVEDIEGWSNSPYLKCTNHKIGLSNDWLTFKNVLVNEDTIIIYYLTDERQVRIATFLLDNYKTQKELKWDILKSCVEFFLNNDNFSTETLETSDFDDNNEYEEILDTTPTQNDDHGRTKYLMETHSLTLSKRYSYRDVEKVCGDCSHFNACMQGYQTIATTCCMFDSLYKARKNPGWHHVSLNTLANLDFDMLDTKRQKYMTIYKLARNTIKSMYKCKSITQYRSLTSRLISYVHSAYRHERCTIALVQYVRAKIADVNVNCNVQSSVESEEFGYHESRRYN